MSATRAPRSMTTEELLALPDDGVERWLIDGELREKPMTWRNRFHSQIMSTISYHLLVWQRQQPAPRGKVLCGDVGVQLVGDRDTTVGVDVVYISADTAQAQNDESTIVVGTPVLAVEILSPSDTQEEINEKIDAYLKAGVGLVWIVDPHHETIVIYRRERPPELVNRAGELPAEPHLPGFRVAAAQIFE